MNPGIDVSQLPLRDIQLPDPVSWWPPAPGWWLLLAAALLAVAYAALHRYRFRRHRAALRAIARLTADLAEGADPARCLQAASVVLRRFAMTEARGAGSDQVPGMVGARWLEYLDARFGPGAFRERAGRMLLEAPYAPAGRVSREEALALAGLCADWIKAQRPGG